MGDGRFIWQPMQALVNFVQTPPHASATYTYPISFNSPSSPLCLFSSSPPQSPLYQALMSHHQGPVTAYPPPSHVYPPPTPYPPPGQVYPPPPSWEGQHQVIYVAAPPPVGYPMRDGEGHPQNHRPVETKSRGDGFWKGCAAALCCCCVLDCCF
ncbi:hypothetical protein AAG906_029189 [Vitis piasezkii]